MLSFPEIVLNDDAAGSTKLALWSNPGNGTLGQFTRSARVMGSAEKLLGHEVVHYHSKQLLKHPNAGGVWNWHQDYGYWYKDYFLTPEMVTCCENQEAIRCAGWCPDCGICAVQI